MGDREGGRKRAAMDIENDPVSIVGRQIAQEQRALVIGAGDTEMLLAGIELVDGHHGTLRTWSPDAQKVAPVTHSVRLNHYGQFRSVAR